MISKHQFNIRNTKKVFHKVGKHWAVVSAIVLSLVTGVAATPTQVTHADNNHQQIQSTVNHLVTLKRKAADTWNDAWTKADEANVSKATSQSQKMAMLKGIGQKVTNKEAKIIKAVGINKAYSEMPKGEHNDAYSDYTRASKSSSRLARKMANLYAQSTTAVNGKLPSVSPTYPQPSEPSSVKPNHQAHRTTKRKAKPSLIKQLKSLKKRLAKIKRSLKRARYHLKRARGRKAKRAACRTVRKMETQYRTCVKRYNRVYRAAVRSAYKRIARTARHGSRRAQRRAKRILSRLNHEKRIIKRLKHKHRHMTKRTVRNLKRTKAKLAKLENSLVK